MKLLVLLLGAEAAVLSLEVVVVPGHDPIRPLSRYEVLRHCIPDVEFVVYDGLPHNITDAAADRCAEDLRRFLLNRAPRLSR
jgi:hypothetical protein